MKATQEELEGKATELDWLDAESRQLDGWAGHTGATLASVDGVVATWTNLKMRLSEGITHLSAEIADRSAYQQCLHDTEKWLLQVSFQLMAHNSLYITNRQQTQEQIEQHNSLLQEIIRYLKMYH